ncbi:MAG: hypothetical protein U0271_21640 [Polyangiaceae bacterium]
MTVRYAALLLSVTTLSACGDAHKSPSSARGSEPLPLPPSALDSLEPPRARASAAPPEAPIEPVGDACSFDWVDLDEAMRVCMVLGEPPKTAPWKLRVRKSPEKLVVPSGGDYRLVIGLGRERDPAARGPWVADLDDHCKTAMHPTLLDAAGNSIEDVEFIGVPNCPSTRARVELSGRGEITTTITGRAVRHEVVTAAPAPRPQLANRGSRWREVPLPPGRYRLQIPLPTPASDQIEVDLEVTAPEH